MKEKSREIDSKNIVIKRLIKEKSVLEARHDDMEDEIDIVDLLKANFGELTTKDFLNLTDITFPVDLIDLDFPSLDLKTEQLSKSLPSSSIKLRKISSTEAKEVSELFQIPNRGNTKVDKQKKVGDTKMKKMARIQEVSPLKIIKDDDDFKLVKKSQFRATQKPSTLRPPSKQFKPNFLASEKLLSSLSISCPHCGKTFPRSSQWMLVEHMNSFHNTAISYPCQFCDNQFTCKSILTAHTMRHKLTYPWECDKCGYKPRDISSFVKHVKGVHGVDCLEDARKMLLLSKS